MTLLSLFMTSTGVFCFVPISQRLTESGIIPASESNRWRFQGVPCILAHTLYAHREEKVQILLPADKIGNDRSEAEVSVPLFVAGTSVRVEASRGVIIRNHRMVRSFPTRNW
ncbi:hypothetical protein L210DRAFT_2859047 [Boletus edulis BED1]|uniref:Uncharacterized protein n=1 Tax=Boletus edulis BED1 TaxID=1328754 RepID=A0AAD4B9D1_BOLED|nr:hypothetical protein L210DRAFT_2859047 [Boletus edulis BED1]